MDISNQLSVHVATVEFEQLPPHTIDMAKKCLLDGLGVILAAGSLDEGCAAFVRLARASAGTTESTIFGHQIRVPSFMAAFANGAMSHALDFEDAHEGALLHPNAATIPAAMAVAESMGAVNGKQLITSIVVGCDLVCRLGLALTADPLKRGFYTPPILGAFGAAAAAGRLLGLTASQLKDAFSLTLCQETCSGEIRNSPQSLIRAIRDGFSAKAGVLSALLAREGVTGFESPFEGASGLYAMYSGGQFDPRGLLHELGDRYEIDHISFKPWPSCRGGHAYVEATMHLLSAHDIAADQVEAIRLFVGPQSISKVLCEPLASKRRPRIAIDAKFSLPFVIASTVLYGAPRLDHFTPEALKNPATLAMAARIDYKEDAAIEWKDPGAGHVQIRTRQGKILSHKVAHAIGHPSNPLGEAALVEKFLDCAAHAARDLSEDKLKRAVDMIFNLEKEEDISRLARLLS